MKLKGEISIQEILDRGTHPYPSLIYWIPFDYKDLQKMPLFRNQILFLYRNGQVEAIPQKMTLDRIQGYLGYRALRITHFAVLPHRAEKESPAFIKGDNLNSLPDFYKILQDYKHE